MAYLISFSETQAGGACVPFLSPDSSVRIDVCVERVSVKRECKVFEEMFENSG